ncbi:hypothetical protein T310_3241 [Rasamsonia emersonii CBS 393.64]|uniref:AAA+ ATPase domain-containing protein n=1 Tax=Rasamsonia emersonii (strain ATCC 16479 / CBS 393.64 / IMI 116815) TaxID=1408163 RepID=A0A0F4YWR9_RASE3|nr:hypothetical protein T310_3241 [Rasamsonia emersonii CBS 393.64]KKA22737.1 hypothetical protein T310_3241 [Rasamsonia emersonii CBS 393.64]
MGQGEQQKLHPFFRQYPRRTNRNPSQASSSHPPSSDQDQTTENNNVLGKCTEPPHVQAGPQGLSAVQAHFNCQHAHVESPEIPQDASLEEDPNSNRRKRLRTSAPWESDDGGDDRARLVHDAHGCDVSQDLDVQTSRRDREVQSPCRDISSGIDYTLAGGGEGHVSQNVSGESTGGTVNVSKAIPEPAAAAFPSPESQGSAQNSSALDALESAEAAGSNPPGTEKKSPPRKVLKLNPNGKLLSSPPSSRFEDKTKNKSKNKRKTADKKTKDSRVVVIKYGDGADSKESIGKMVDDIIHGRQRHVSRRQDVSNTSSGPPKPTHPFFLKNTGRKPEKSAPITNTSSIPEMASSNKAKEANEKSTSSGNIRETVSQTTRSTVPFPRSHLPRYPDPIAPLWPPRDMVHVRGAEFRPFRDAPGPVLPGPRKDKGSAMGVSDSENVLLAELRRSLNTVSDSQNPLPPTDAEVLRIPKRHLASGSVLQKGINNQLSYHTVVEPGSTHKTARSGISTKQRRRHPAVTKLHSSIPSTMSAFDTGNFESVPWTQKYAPTCAEEVLQVGPEAAMLRDWLKNLMVSAVDTGRPGKDKPNKKRPENSKKAKRRKASDKLDGFIVSSGDEASEMDELPESDEDELAGDVTVPFMRTVVRAGDLGARSKGGNDKGRMVNAVLISGPSGCGKTASVYAVAKELDFEVFEINSGTRRSARDILERVGDMTQNHLVNNLDSSKEGIEDDSSQDIQPQELGPIDAKQTTMNSFFKATPRDTSNRQTQKKDKQKKDQKPDKTVSSTVSRPQKQSLILLEEADILFEEDKQFWTGVMTLISQSKRPIIITCNNENLIPLQDLSLHAILRYRPPPHDLAVDYLLLLAANEGHMLKREAVSDLYSASNQDLRRSIMELSFWCQMAVGSEKSGLDWIIDRWPPGSDLDVHGDRLRVISLNTYEPFMGWFNRDMLMSKNVLARETELLLEGLNWWQLDFQDMPHVEGSKFLVSDNNHVPPGGQDAMSAPFDLVQKAAELADSQSVLDVFSRRWSLKQEEDELDTSVPDLPEKQRSNYVEGYPLIHADCKPDYTGLSASIGSTVGVLISHLICGDHQDSERLAVERVLEKAANSKITRFSGRDFITAFEPIMRADYVFPPPTGRTAPSFENGTAVIAEDLAPYIRAIMAFDLRLEQYRLELSGLMSQGSSGKRKARTTRASRAALEGGDKATTRRERWFPRDANPSRILATGSKEWQNVLVQYGHFNVPSIRQERRGSSHSVSDSSGDGGF